MHLCVYVSECVCLYVSMDRLWHICEGQRTTSAVDPFLTNGLTQDHLAFTPQTRLAGLWASWRFSHLQWPSHWFHSGYRHLHHTFLWVLVFNQVFTFSHWAISSVPGLPSEVEDLHSHWAGRAFPSSSPEVSGFQEQGQCWNLKVRLVWWAALLVLLSTAFAKRDAG